MKGIEKITARIAADAAAEIEVVEAESKVKCDEITAQYAKKAEAKYAEVLAAGMEENEQRVQRTDRTAKLDAKKALLQLKQDMVTETFTEAAKKICEISEDEYVSFLAKEAAAAVITGQEDIILNEKDRETVGKKVVKAANAILAEMGKEAHLTLSDKTAEMSGGLILKQGDIEVNCTVDTLLELCRGDLAAEVAKVLFD